MNIKKTFGLIILLIISLESFAQNQEYIITYDNDTLYGKVKRRIDYGHSRYNFKFKQKGKKTKTIKPNEIKLFHTIGGLDGNAFFESASKVFFVKRIIDGKIKLYISVGDKNGEAPSYYFSKNNSYIKSSSIGSLFSKKKAHEQIRKSLEDKSEIVQEFDSLNGSLKNIKYIIKKYNSLTN